MKRRRRKGRPKPAHTVGLAVLVALILFGALVVVPTAGLGQPGGGSTVVLPAPGPANSGVLSAHRATAPQSSPDAVPRQWFRLMAVLCSGLVISTARLARKFRLFWGLGVFANPYAVLFLAFGVGLCGIPVTLQDTLAALPLMGNLGPWVADLSGIAIALALPAIRLKPKARAAAENQVPDLEGDAGSNPILAVIEDAIKEHILQRMQKEVVAACRRYDMSVIKLAAARALEEEMTIRPLTEARYTYLRRKIENFDDKYDALIGILGWCSFYRLRRSLDMVKSETQP
jgi:hypothetical protein